MLFDDYVETCRKYESEYGSVVVLFQVGSFYEIYGCLDQEIYGCLDQEINDQDPRPKRLGCDVKLICSLLNIQSTRKNKNLETSKTNPELGGFPSVSLPKYLPILVDEGYTIVVVDQVRDPREVDRPRELDRPRDQVDRPREIDRPRDQVDRRVVKIVSKSTFVNESTKPVSLACVSIRGLEYGIATLDLSTGRSRVSRGLREDIFSKFVAESVVEVLVLSEFVNGEFVNGECREFGECREIDPRLIHKAPRDLVLSCNDVQFQNEVLKRVYPRRGFLTPVEYVGLESPSELAAFVGLVDFAFKHDETLLVDLPRPQVNSIVSRDVLLSETVFSDLDISQTARAKLVDKLDHCSTSMGRRLFRRRLMNPIVDSQELRRRYGRISRLDKYEEVLKRLKGVVDIDRLWRKILLTSLKEVPTLVGTLTCCSIVSREFQEYRDSLVTRDSRDSLVTRDSGDSLVTRDSGDSLVTRDSRDSLVTRDSGDSLVTLDRLSTIIRDSRDSLVTRDSGDSLVTRDSGDSLVTLDRLSTIIRDVISELEAVVDDDGEIRRGVSEDLDKLAKDISEFTTRYDEFANDLYEISRTFGDDWIKGLKEREQYCTSKRFATMKSRLETLECKWGRLVVLEVGAKETKFSFKEIQELKRSMEPVTKAYEDVHAKVTRELQRALGEELSDRVSRVSDMIAEMDVDASCAKDANDHAMTMPVIVEDQDSRNSRDSRDSRNSRNSQVFRAVDLRHPLSERTLRETHFVPNSLSFSSSRGLLIYGVNAAGKSTLLKSVAVAVIMAQAGMFVAAKEFEFRPYEKIFTRMAARDDLVEGRSTFVVELAQLRDIVRKSDQRTLVVGDELCNGTEGHSAVSILGATCKHLTRTGSTFVFATHFHELSKISLPGVEIVHMATRYDRDLDTLVYERKISPGPGRGLYGLEVAQSMHIGTTFMLEAHEIRRELLGLSNSIVDDKKSRYNARVFADVCRVCGEPATETHHVLPQKLAVKKLIGHVAKNSKANLIPLCESCHGKTHKDELEIGLPLQTLDGVFQKFSFKV